MYHPEDVDEATYALYTKALVDCKVKDETEYSDEAPTGYNVDETYEFVVSPGGRFKVICFDNYPTDQNPDWNAGGSRKFT